MSAEGTKRLQTIVDLIDICLKTRHIPITRIAKELKIRVSSAKEYLAIIQYLSTNPVNVQIERRNRFTFVTITRDLSVIEEEKKKRNWQNQKRFSAIREIIRVGLTEKHIPITRFKEDIGININSIREYLAIIHYVSSNPMNVQIERRNRFTFVSMTKEGD